MNGLAEDEAEVEAWIGAASAAFAGGVEPGASPPAVTRLSGTTGWTCLGEGPEHAVERERLETLKTGGSTTLAIERAAAAPASIC